MGVVKPSGTLWMSEIHAALAGGNALSGYYRGSEAVPTVKSVGVTESPAYSRNYNCWRFYTSGNIWWNGNIYSSISAIAANTTSYSVDGKTFYRGAFAETYRAIYKYYAVSWYYVTTVAINTNVPSSGQLNFSQLYGAERP